MCMPGGTKGPVEMAQLTAFEKYSSAKQHTAMLKLCIAMSVCCEFCFRYGWQSYIDLFKKWPIAEAGGVNNVDSIPPESWQAIREFLRKSNAVKSSVPMNQGAPSPDSRQYQLQEISHHNNNDDTDFIYSSRQIPHEINWLRIITTTG